MNERNWMTVTAGRVSTRFVFVVTLGGWLAGGIGNAHVRALRSSATRRGFIEKQSGNSAE